MVKYIVFEMRIKDSGMGISPENLSRLFLDFHRLEEHQHSNFKGTGLGLSICKRLIELMGGFVKVESEVGVGTTFTVNIRTQCQELSEEEYEKLLNRDNSFLKEEQNF